MDFDVFIRHHYAFFVIMLNKIIAVDSMEVTESQAYDKGSSSHYRDVVKDDREFGRSASLSANVRFLSKRQWSLGLSTDGSLSLTR